MNFITTSLLTGEPKWYAYKFQYNFGALRGICRDEIRGAIMEMEYTVQVQSKSTRQALTSSCTKLILYLLHTYLLQVLIWLKVLHFAEKKGLKTQTFSEDYKLDLH